MPPVHAPDATLVNAVVGFLNFVARLPGLTRCALAIGGLDLARQLAEGVEPTVPLYAHSLRKESNTGIWVCIRRTLI